MNRPPIDIDDTRLTDFLLSEMPLNESKDFQQQLKQSPLAQREMAAMEDVMSLLTDGLKSEWSDRSDVSGSLELVTAPAEEKENVIVEMHKFGKTAPSRAKILSLAAVLTGMLVVGSLVLNQRDNTGRDYADASTPAVVVEDISTDDVSVDRGSENPAGVPALLLAEEVKDFDLLVAELESPVLPVDDSYLDDGAQMIKASYGGSDSSGSYLPLETRGVVSVNLQLGDVSSEIVSDAAGKGRMKTYTRSGSWSGSGRLSLISSYGGMQADLAHLVEALDNNEGALSASQAAQIKEQLRSILKQSKEIGGHLAR